ncbi:uncharacterized protein LOC112590745 [Harpegnathos saltator]|uniref:uncharacterized protein LOC112590745 n=1 Tax=Harpegnathos saltator TaxID=610380 RepID=UPI000DBED9F4|nr:uncharacterized protein LOC112590745 [Harpegnathos saltator]
MPIIGCTKEDNCRRDAFLRSRLANSEQRAAGKPHEEGSKGSNSKKLEKEKKMNEKEEEVAAVLSGVPVNPDSPGNPNARHATGGKHLGERAAAAEPSAVAQKDRVEIPRTATSVPETLVQAGGQADVPEPSVGGRETGFENQRAPREIPDNGAPWEPRDDAV